jgi:hypothetical protein
MAATILSDSLTQRPGNRRNQARKGIEYHRGFGVLHSAQTGLQQHCHYADTIATRHGIRSPSLENDEVNVRAQHSWRPPPID